MHHWDHMVLPKDPAINPAGIGMALDPVWNLLRLYDIPAIVDADGKPVRFNTREEFWQSPDMEPRARATFFFSGMTEPASGQVFDFQGGVYKSFPGLAADATADTDNRSQNDYTQQWRITGTRALEEVNINGEMVRVTGKHGTTPDDEGPTESGFVIRKYVSNSTARGEAGNPLSIQSFKVLRYGEVLMNAAEAAYELGLEKGDAGLKAEAFEYIAQIRERAGAKPYTMKDAPIDLGMLPIEEGGLGYIDIPVDENLQFIRDERARELAFENHHIFDMIRWRVAYPAYQDSKYRLRSCMPYYVLDEDKWIFLSEVVGQNRAVSFNRNNYYRQIPGGVIERNGLVKENDVY